MSKQVVSETSYHLFLYSRLELKLGVFVSGEELAWEFART